MPTKRNNKAPTTNDEFLSLVDYCDDSKKLTLKGLDFGGWTGEEIWDMLVESLQEKLPDERAYRFLRRAKFNARDCLNDTMTVTIPWMPSQVEVDKLLDAML